VEAIVAKTLAKRKREHKRRAPVHKRAKDASSPDQAPASAAAGDDTIITALDLPPAELSPAMQAYFQKCEERLGLVPNVLKAYAFHMAKLEPFPPA
jgi:hypothetical protein